MIQQKWLIEGEMPGQVFNNHAYKYSPYYAINQIFTSAKKVILDEILLPFEPSHEKTNNLDFQPGPTQTSMYSLISRLEA